jgi:hypothetical protein
VTFGRPYRQIDAGGYEFGQMATKESSYKDLAPGVTTRRRHGRGLHEIENRLGVGLSQQRGNDPVAVDCAELGCCIPLGFFFSNPIVQGG